MLSIFYSTLSLLHFTNKYRKYPLKGVFAKIKQIKEGWTEFYLKSDSITTNFISVASILFKGKMVKR